MKDVYLTAELRHIGMGYDGTILPHIRDLGWLRVTNVMLYYTHTLLLIVAMLSAGRERTGYSKYIDLSLRNMNALIIGSERSDHS